MQTYAILQCTNPQCNLRCPATDGQRMDRCPRCHAPAVIDAAGAVEREEAAAGRANAPRLPLTLVLDNVRSAFNVGSMLRSADGAGVRTVWLAGITPGVDHPRVAKTALGAERSLDVRTHSNALELVRSLKREGAIILALESAPESRSLFALALPAAGEIVLIAGNEVTGVDPAVRACADALVELPMRGSKQSYNVAIAAGAALILLGERLHEERQLKREEINADN